MQAPKARAEILVSPHLLDRSYAHGRAVELAIANVRLSCVVGRLRGRQLVWRRVLRCQVAFCVRGHHTYVAYFQSRHVRMPRVQEFARHDVHNVVMAISS